MGSARISEARGQCGVSFCVVGRCVGHISWAYCTGGREIGIDLILHKAGGGVAATEFVPSYRRATVMQATGAAVGLLSPIAAWLAGATFWWLVAGVLLGSVIPFTLIDLAHQQAIAESVESPANFSAGHDLVRA